MPPRCEYCKKVRTEDRHWRPSTSDDEGDFSRAVCPTCYREIVEPELEAFKKKNRGA